MSAELLEAARRWPESKGTSPVAAAADLIARLADALEDAESAIQRMRAMFPMEDPCPPRECTHIDCEIFHALNAVSIQIDGSET